MINSKQDWWTYAEDNKENILSIIENYHPYYTRKYYEQITAPNAEKVCEIVREQIRENVDIDPLIQAKTAYTSKNTVLADLLNSTWFGVPESTDCWRIEGFKELCELCETSYLLQD